MEVELCRDNDWLLSEEAYAIYAPCMYNASYMDYKLKIESYISNQLTDIFVCTENEKKLGILVLNKKEFEAEIMGIAVSSKFHNRGIGRLLISTVMNYEQMECMTAQTDDDAIEFYRKCGFSDEKIIKEYPDGKSIRYNCLLRKSANDGYTCKIASLDEMEQKWNYEIELHSEKTNWIIWKKEAIDHFRKGLCIPYYGIRNGEIICEATAILTHNFGLDNTVELNGFRTIKEYRGKGYFSRLKNFILSDLKQKGYLMAVVGVEPCEEINKKIYGHWGFTEYITSETETYPDGTVIEAEFYGKKL